MHCWQNKSTLIQQSDFTTETFESGLEVQSKQLTYTYMESEVGGKARGSITSGLQTTEGGDASQVHPGGGQLATQMTRQTANQKSFTVKNEGMQDGLFVDRLSWTLLPVFFLH